MAQYTLIEKLAILSDAAKYDASPEKDVVAIKKAMSSVSEKILSVRAPTIIK